MSNKVPWWQSVAPGSRKRVILMQIDIGGHSAWLSTIYMHSFQEAYLERKRFSTNLENDLSPLGYELLFWAGDGGVYVALLDSSGHPANVCEAADRIFKVFNEWKRDKNVEIRVTATSLELSVGPDPAFWCGPDLNSFLKYERQIALSNAFVITQELRTSLVTTYEKNRFVDFKHVRLPNNEIVTIYIDTEHQYKFEESSIAFFPWLKKMIDDNKLPKGEKVERGLYRVGYCTILDGARQFTGYGEILLEQVAPLDIYEIVDEQDREDWTNLRRQLEEKKVSGISLQVAQFTGELIDDPHPRLKYRTVAYKDARSFHSIAEHKSDTNVRYRARALNVLNDDGTSIPNILSTAVIAIIGSDNNDAKLVIANRRGRSGGYDQNTWSVTIGEQFRPITSKRGDRELVADGSLINSAVRGMKEELLSKDYNGNMKLTIHSFCLEDHINDYFFIALADLRPLEFSELVKFWNNTEDRAEHDAIAAFRVCDDFLLECLKEEQLPASVWENIQKDNLFAFAPGIRELPEGSHRWQSNSHVRLATALWFSNSIANVQHGQ